MLLERKLLDIASILGLKLIVLLGFWPFETQSSSTRNFSHVNFQHLVHELSATGTEIPQKLNFENNSGLFWEAVCFSVTINNKEMNRSRFLNSLVSHRLSFQLRSLFFCTMCLGPETEDTGGRAVVFSHEVNVRSIHSAENKTTKITRKIKISATKITSFT